MATIQWNPPPETDLEREITLYRKAGRRINILVVGIGGAGCAAVEHMRGIGLPDVSFWMLDTDIAVDVERDSILRHQLGGWEPDRHGTNGDRSLGFKLAANDRSILKALLEGYKVAVFVTGLGGGTGTGAAPVISRLSKNLGIVTVHAITLPLSTEGRTCRNNADFCVEELRLLSDGVLVAPEDLADGSQQEVFGARRDWLFQVCKGISKITNNAERGTSNFGEVERAFLGESYVRGWGGRHMVQMFDATVAGAGSVSQAARELGGVARVKNSLAKAKSVLAYYEAPGQATEEDIDFAFLALCGMASERKPHSCAFSSFHRADLDDRVRITLYTI